MEYTYRVYTIPNCSYTGIPNDHARQAKHLIGLVSGFRAFKRPRQAGVASNRVSIRVQVPYNRVSIRVQGA